MEEKKVLQELKLRGYSLSKIGNPADRIFGYKKNKHTKGIDNIPDSAS